MKKRKRDQVLLQVEELEQRIAPDVSGTGGYDGQPDDQALAFGNPSGSANPEGIANPENSVGDPRDGKDEH